MALVLGFCNCSSAGCWVLLQHVTCAEGSKLVCLIAFRSDILGMCPGLVVRLDHNSVPMVPGGPDVCMVSSVDAVREGHCMLPV